MINTEKGFTLIEVLIAVAILTVAVMSVFMIYTQCTVEIRRAKNRTIATNYAQQMMEMISSTPYNIFYYHGLTTTSDPPADNPVRDDLLRWKAALQTFPTRATGIISVVADQESPHSIVVTVKITYDNYGREVTNTLSLKIARRSS
jgi:prepilin-type N-terminal cleavage/methylation domain-containing protein